MNDIGRFLPAAAVVVTVLLLAVRYRLSTRDRPWWVWAVLDTPALAAACGGLLAWAAPTWVAVPAHEILHPTFLFFAGWVGLEIGCGLDLRVVRRAAVVPFLNETAMALAAAAAVFAAAYTGSRLIPGMPAPMPAALLVLAGVCVAGPALPRTGAALSRGAGRGGFWNPSAAASLAVLLAATGSALAPWPALETIVPGWDVRVLLEIDSVFARLLWAMGAGCLAGFVADLATKDDFAPGGLYPQLAAVVLIAAGIAGAVGLETLLVGTVAGFWLINATLRRLDILHVLERGASLSRLLAPFLGGWLVGGGVGSAGFDMAAFGLVLVLVMFVRPAARILGRRVIQVGQHAARRRRPEPFSAALAKIDELGILLAAVLTRLLEPAAGVGALAAVLLAQWLLGVGASAWDQRKMGGKIEPPTRK